MGNLRYNKTYGQLSRALRLRDPQTAISGVTFQNSSKTILTVKLLCM